MYQEIFQHSKLSPLDNASKYPSFNEDALHIRFLKWLYFLYKSKLYTKQRPIYHINPFVPNTPFLYNLKTSENRKSFLYFQGVEKRCIWNKWVKLKIQKWHSKNIVGKGIKINVNYMKQNLITAKNDKLYLIFLSAFFFFRKHILLVNIFEIKKPLGSFI